MTLEEIVSEDWWGVVIKVDIKDIKKNHLFFTNVGISGQNSIYILQIFVKNKDTQWWWNKWWANRAIFFGPKDVDDFLFDENKAKTQVLCLAYIGFKKMRKI